MWKHHVFYESRPRSVIVTLGGHLYRIPEVVPIIVPTKRCRKVFSHTSKFILFTICSEEKDTTITTTSSQDPSIQYKQINKIVEEHQDILIAPTRLPPHFPVKPIVGVTSHTPRIYFS
jgi:hypothetical protein